MAYYIHYKQTSRNWGQHTLGDYVPGLNEINKQIVDFFEEARWNLKKVHYAEMKKKGVKNLPVLRRGRIRIRYPSKNHYYMDFPRDVAEVKQFSWFSPAWCKSRSSPHVLLKGQTTIDSFLEVVNHRISPHHVPKIYIPHFRMPRYTMKEDFCDQMNPWAWEACHMPSKKVGLCTHVFYLNNFDFFDEPAFIDDVKWIGKALPSDLIKLELHRLLQGFESINDYFRMYELSPTMMDPQAINMTHTAPSSHHYTEYLKRIGVDRVEAFFKLLVEEARQYGLIRDIVHLWDGQFHETWIKKNKPRKANLEQFYGGIYNHGGKKVGVGVYQSTIMDWNGYCAIPIHTHIVSANRNENPVLRETVNNAYTSQNPQPVPYFFLADRGPSGKETQDKIWDLGAIPIIPLKKNIKNGVRITKKNKHRFYKKYVDDTDSSVLDRLYNVRTRIEEHYNLNETVYKTAHLHCMGERLTRIEILLLNCLGVLIPLTAFKIGRPDLMWSPTSFRSHSIHPRRVFSEHFREIEQIRWNNEDTVNPQRYPNE